MLAAVVHDPERLTQIQSYKGWGFVTISALLIFLVTAHFVRSVTRAEASLETARLDYRRLVETTSEGVQVTDRDGATVFVNDRLCELTDVPRDRLLAHGLTDLIADPSASIRPDGRQVWAIVSETPITDPAGHRTGTLRVYTDNTERRLASDELGRSLETQRLLVSELDHRVRNNLASLVAMVELSSGGNPELNRFARTVSGRIRIMAAAYTLLSANRWRPVPLRTIIAEVTAAAEERRDLDGPELAVSMEQVVPLMLVLHELMCNARDHGALRSPAGRIDIRWRATSTAEDRAGVVIDWSEHGGPPIVGTPPNGFGLAVARGIAGSDLRGQLDCTFTPEGVHATLALTLGVTEDRRPTQAAPNGARGNHHPLLITHDTVAG
jgi:two-component sensor histidine kinase